jgi:hypothetical protein
VVLAFCLQSGERINSRSNNTRKASWAAFGSWFRTLSYEFPTVKELLFNLPNCFPSSGDRKNRKKSFIAVIVSFLIFSVLVWSRLKTFVIILMIISLSSDRRPAELIDALIHSFSIE